MPIFSFKTALTSTLVAAVTCLGNAEGADVVPATPKPAPLVAEGLRLRGGYDTYEMDEIQPGFLKKIHSLKKKRAPDEVFATALSDSAIVRLSHGDLWLIRVFYTPEDRSPWKDTAWIAKLSEKELPGYPTRLGGPPSKGPSIFTIPEVVPVRIPKAMAGFMEPFRATKAVVLERESQLWRMLESLERTVRDSDSTEEIFRSQAESIRKYGSCRSGNEAEGQSDEGRAAKLERSADEIRDKRSKDLEALNRYRSVILPQLKTPSGKTRSGL